jgi:hypothetical protein
MKKILPVILVVLVIGGWWMTREPRQETNSTQTETQKSASSSDSTSSPSTSPINIGGFEKREPANIPQAPADADTEGEVAEQVKPATEAYSSAEEALAAVMKGSKDFDDSILEQFTQPGEDCSWCPQFYSSVRDMVANPNTPQDQKSYLSELLAISGRVENVQSLTELVKNAKSSNEADVYAEALEYTLGKDDVVRFLGEQLSTSNDTLREASIAAITNQGSRTSVEILSKYAKEAGDPDAQCSIGIGPCEVIPDADARPLVVELVQKRDEMSPVWAKALINSGQEGLSELFTILESSNNPDSDRALLKGARDHVNYEDGIKETVENIIATSKNPASVEFAKEILQDLNEQDAQEDDGTVEP